MHTTVQNLIKIENEIKLNLVDLKVVNLPKIIAVSKTFKIDKILPLIDYGHIDFGENKIQEAVDKWTEIKSKNTNIKLHMIGKLQTNKVKFAVKLFDYIHSVDNKKLAKKIADEQKKVDKKIKIFIQVNIGNEEQKSGINKTELGDLVLYCKNINLDILGLMCIPPQDEESSMHFAFLKKIAKRNNLTELSMGMSNDFEEAIKFGTTSVRIGSLFFGAREL